MGSKKNGKGTPGPAPLGDQRTEFMRLISIGVSNSEACRRVGVNRRTGKGWRLGRTVVLASGAVLENPPVATSSSSKRACARYLSEHERVLIGDGLRAGATMTRIAADLGRATSTITREVPRNSDETGAYRPFAAHPMALARLPRLRQRRLAKDGALRDVVQGWLDKRWSPEQISHSLRIQYPEVPAWHLAHESIYQGIYDRKCPLAQGISACLRTRRRRRRPHRVTGSRRGGGPRDMTMSDERPSQADDRVEAGHWEGTGNLNAVVKQRLATRGRVRRRACGHAAWPR